MTRALPPTPHRHAELVSASTAPQWLSSQAAKWTLNQVQGDARIGYRRGDKDIFTVAEALGTAI
ncbi:hypothetical protein [Sphingomonas aquatica]|uniref:hypothetical protein n=1 Tax=Sphingomonas aquatica TaxID=1763824 RepID=UPI001454DDF1